MAVFKSLTASALLFNKFSNKPITSNLSKVSILVLVSRSLKSIKKLENVSGISVTISVFKKLVSAYNP